jgi:hypothetical protein
MTLPLEIDPRKEFAQAELGDRRLNARLDMLINRLVEVPDRSFPSATNSDAELEGAYRFFGNSRVTLFGLIQPHLDATVKRAESAGSVVILHDTTEFRFEGMKKRAGLGELAGNGQGFFGHFALAISGANERVVLGLAGLLTFVRDQGRRSLREVDQDRRATAQRGESARWFELFSDTNERMWHLDPVHVMDREADDFALFSEMVRVNARFVIRMTTQRRRQGTSPDVSTTSPYVESLMKAAPVIATREVRLTARPGKRGGESERTHPVRECRQATLSISAAVVDVAPPKASKLQPLRLSVVRVAETSPPPGEQPVEWILLTNESIESPEQVLAIVDLYRARWTIEEYFKALKTGCAIERRQLESVDALLAALGVFAPIAARLLALRTYARVAPDADATTIITVHEVRALRAIGRTPISKSPTVREVLFAIASLGGHLKRNGEPGWLTLARGFEKLDIATRVVASILDEESEK